MCACACVRVPAWFTLTAGGEALSTFDSPMKPFGASSSFPGAHSTDLRCPVSCKVLSTASDTRSHSSVFPHHTNSDLTQSPAASQGGRGPGACVLQTAEAGVMPSGGRWEDARQLGRRACVGLAPGRGEACADLLDQVCDMWMFSLRKAAKVFPTHPLPSPCSPASRWPAWHSRRHEPCQEHLWRWSQNSGLTACQPPGDRPAQGKEWHQFTLGLAKAPSTIPGPGACP